PTPRLRASAAHLRSNQISQPEQPQLARNVPSVQLGEHGELPVLHPAQLGFQSAQLSQQLRIRGGCQLFDHVFDSNLPDNAESTIYVKKTHINKGQTHRDNETQATHELPPR